MKNYIVEADFEHEGLRCIVLGLSIGHRCGYVGIDKKHPLYGANYHEKAMCLKMEDLADAEIGKRGRIPIICADMETGETTPDVYFDVHGSLTYSGGNAEYPVKSNGLWWFGFDCAHHGDAKDPKLIDTEKYGASMIFETGAIRTIDFCINECKSLAGQLLALR